MNPQSKPTPIQIKPATPTAGPSAPKPPVSPGMDEDQAPKMGGGSAGKIIAIVIVILLVVAGGYFGYTKWKSQNDQITKLKLEKAAAEKAKTDAEKAAEDAKAAADKTADSSTFAISELKLAIKPGADLAGLTYAYDPTLKIAYFTTRDIAYKVDVDTKAKTYLITSGLIGSVMIFDTEPPATVTQAAAAQMAPLQKIAKLSNGKLLYAAVPNATAIGATTTVKATQDAIKAAQTAFLKVLATATVTQ